MSCNCHNHEHHDHHHEEHEECEVGKCSCCHDEEETGVKTIIFSFLLLLLGLCLEHFTLPIPSNIIKYAYVFSYLIAFLLVGKNVVIGAIHNLYKGQVLDEQFLMTVASLGALFVGEIPEAVGIMLFYQIGEAFQDYAVDKSRDSINSLMEIRPDEATVLRDGKEVSVDADEVEIGEIVIVKPGERIPVDGIITEGKTFLDNSSLTGESVLVEGFVGNEVYSGSINKTALIHIEVIHKAEESAASRILKLVEESQQKKTQTERFITRFAKVYTPIVCSLALIVAILVPLCLKYISPTLFAEYGWKVWIYRALMFLVVSCPCAIVISVPLTFFGGIGSLSRKAILVKGSGALEALSKITTCVFDKTGTLTKGVFVVTEVKSLNPSIPEDELIAIASHGETYSNHPVSASLKKAHNGKCCSLAKLEDFQEISGQGIKVNLNDKEVLIGNAKLMKSQGVSNFTEVTENKGGTIIYVSQESSYCGYIVISDETKAEAKDTIKDLHKIGVKNIVMLTGDKKEVADKIGKDLGLNEVYGDLLPEHKVSKVEELLTKKRKNENLAFVGDGINDAPVLTRSDVGIAMGGIGSDAAIESADVVIMDDKISRIKDAIIISRKTISVAKQNIILSLAIKCAIMVLSAIGLTNMWIAVFGDTGVALLAVCNALRTLKK